MPEPESIEKLRDLIGGYQRTQALYVAAKLGIPDQLAEGPQRAGALASAVGADPSACYRLLRGLEYLGIVREPTPGAFALTPLGEELRQDSPSALRDEILMTGDAFWRWWAGLEHSVRTGEPSVPEVEGMSAFEFLHRDAERIHRFNRLMSVMVGRMAKGVVASYDFKPFRTVVDVGGGRGTLLSAILGDHPRLRGVLFDLPATAQEARESIAALGLAGRCECVGGDFFTAVPDGDCIVLSAVLSDWNDDQCTAILRNCRRAIAADGTVLVLERLLEPEKPAPESAFLDLQMLVIGGGTGRSSSEYRRLLDGAGLELTRVISTGTARSIFEARPI